MKNKILFVIPSMEIGGTRSSLLNLLNALSREEDLDLSVFIIKHEGNLYAQIPESVMVLPEIKLLAWAIPTRRRHGILRTLFHGLVALLNKVFGYQSVYRALLKVSRKNSIYSYNFDVSIGYQEGIATFLSSEVKAKRYFAWIHSDIDKWYDARNLESEAYNKAQNIFFVAENTKKMFASQFPMWKDKCEVIKNLINKALINQKAKESISDFPTERGNFNLVSIGRFTESKAFDRVIDVAKYLKSKNHKFKWYLVGSGELFESINKQVQHENMNDSVILLGAKNNPYPYMRMSDLVVVSSLNESQPMVILEALTLSKPVVSTGYPSAKEILRGGKYGYICGNDVESLCVAVERVLNDRNLYENLLKGAKEYEYDNDEIIHKLYSYIVSKNINFS